MRVQKFVLAFCMAFMFMFFCTNINAKAAQESLKINNTTLTFNRLIYVSNGGNDTTGDGSKEKPYANVSYAIGKAVSGDGIFIKAGTYRLSPMVLSSYSSAGIADLGKELTILGEKEKTVLQFYGADATTRDGNALCLSNSKTKLMNLSYQYYPAKVGDFPTASNAIFIWCTGSVHNVFFNIKGSVNASYSYYNDAPANNPRVYNCVFYHDNNQKYPNYSGAPLFQNCISNVGVQGATQASCVQKAYSLNNLADSKTDADLVNKGTGTDPDGSQADIGIYGGEFAWGYTPAPTPVSLSVSSVDNAKVGDEIIANVEIHNASTICAEDIKISYDTALLEYVGTVAVDGMKIYKDADLGSGTHRFITASLGKANAANGDKVLLKLKFKAKKGGKAKIDIVKGRIADNATLEMDVTDENCGEKSITIIEVKDVNRTGEFTLLDLGIDSYYYGEAESATDTSKYDADVVDDGKIDDLDLSEIVSQMLNNTNYPANK